MAEPEIDHVERKVVVENVTTTSTRNSAVAWIIIGIAAVALIVYILVHMR
ncbi:MAG TPA: hypothetical protein VF505_02105 [Thermoanaerobaculia bacterium]|jgi:uncharacterized membrane protein YuzA (DUF378 family)